MHADKHGSGHPFDVYKFGGTSLATPDRIRNAAAIVDAESPDVRKVVVVSAFGGVTDRLEKALSVALARDEGYVHTVKELFELHKTAILDLAIEEEQAAIVEQLNAVWSELQELLDGVYLLRECTPRTRDAVMGMGERASAPVVAAAFRSMGTHAVALDSRKLIVTDDAFGEAAVDFEASGVRIRETFSDLEDGCTAVVSGFIAATRRGVATTLGRSGSDYTATILAEALSAKRVVIWTDVAGVLSADPRLVPGAFTLPELSYREAAEMAYFGARVLHPRTMRPLEAKGIPLFIRNSLEPGTGGTLIGSVSPVTAGNVKAVTAVRGMALLMVEGTGMMGVPGIASRMFSALASRGINVLMISQASSEQSICVGIRNERVETAQEALDDAFHDELVRGDISRVFAIEDCAVVSVVGDHMRMKPGLAGRMFSTLGRANINVLAIAQAASETNISAVVAEADIERAVRALHEAFARSRERLHLMLIGPGVVGRALLTILETQAPAIAATHRINLCLAGVANSKRWLWDPEGIPFADAAKRLSEDGEEASLGALVDKLQESHVERLVVIDATASDDVAATYDTLLSSGISVVTPNKRANTGSLAYFDRLQKLSEERDVPFLYETTVGAALPVVSVIRDLVRSGDTIRSIQGVLSGTLAFVFNALRAGSSFSGSVLQAREQGFTEPDPREDLAGEDVARKLLTLARESGRRIERSDIVVQSLVPFTLADLDRDEFLARLPEEDACWGSKTGSRQYLATMDEAGYRVGVEEVTEESPFARLEGTDNMIVITTDRYTERPLVIQGAGAGPELTASGIMADIVKAAERMR